MTAQTRSASDRVRAARARRAARAAEARCTDGEEAAGGVVHPDPGSRVPGWSPPPTLTPRPDLPVLLSSAQRRLWFLSQLEPDSTAYLIPVVLDCPPGTDAGRLREAWLAVVRRHAVLRTRYVAAEAAQPVAVIDPDPDLGAVEIVEGDPEQLTRTGVADGIDLAAQQPWRVRLIRRPDDRLRFAAVLHHIAADGWSVSILLDDLVRAYRGEPLVDPAAPPLQFSDLTRWQHDHPPPPEALDYWVGHLRGAPALTELPTDRPRPAVADPTGATLTVQWGADDGAALLRVARRAGTTPFVVLLAALHVVLSRWTGHDDTVVGTPVAGRTLTESESLVGCCVNTVALRLTSDEHDPVAELLDRAAEVALGGLTHQQVGFEEVVEALDCPRDVASTPLYQVSLTVHTEPGPALELPEGPATWVDALLPVAKADLALHVSGEAVAHHGGVGTGLTVATTYRTALFDGVTVARLGRHLREVVRELDADPGRRVGELSMLTASERAGLPAAVGVGPRTPTPAGTDLGGVIRAVAAAQPDRPAVREADRTWTYAEIIAAADSVAAGLQADGVGPGDRVGLLTGRTGHLVVGMLAAMSLGAAYVPLDPLHPDDRVRDLVRASGARLVLCETHLAGRVPADVRSWDLATRAPTTGLRLPRVGEQDDLYLLFTSGTTGAPKGVPVTHGALLAYLAGLQQVASIQPGWSWAMISTPAADLGLTNLFGALTTGGTVELLSYEEATDPDAVARRLADRPVAAMKLVPSHLAALLGAADPAAVLPRRLLVLAGEACPWELIARVRALAPDLLVHNHYGPTETTVSAMAHPVPPGPLPAKTGTVPLGRPFPGTRAHIVDAAGRPVPDGVVGELVLAGPTVSRSYLGLPEQTAQRFVTEPEPGGAHQAYRTGDLVRRRADGTVDFVGRLDDQVKIRGYRVEPGEIAAALRRHPGVAAAVVVARPRPRGDLELVGYAVPADPADAPTLPSLRQHLRELVPEHLVPAALAMVPDIPVTANGKVDRAALPDVAAGAGVLVDEAPLASVGQQQVAAAFCEVLDLPAAGPRTRFFDVGGDSFSAVRLARALGPPISVVDVFRHPSVAELADLLERGVHEGHDGAGPTLLRRLDTHPDATVHVVCVPYGGGSPVTFAPLARAVGPDVAVHGVDLPGHDPSRARETPRPVGEVADELVAEIADLPGEVVLYGHCLGGALAVETALRCESAGIPVLGVVEAGTFPSARLPGRLARLVDRVMPTDRWLSDRAYHDMLRSLGGFTDVDRADRQFLVAALRHDAREAEDYYTARYAALEDGGDVPRLRAPVLCVVGSKDRATELYQERFAEWGDFSDAVSLRVIDRAGHYFLKHQADELADVVQEHVGAWRGGVRPRTEPPPGREARTSTFLWVAVTQLLSMLGTGLTSFGLSVWVLQRTGSVTLFSLIMVLASLPAIALLPVAGAVADRVDRRRVMLVADAVAGASTATLVALLALGRLELWFVFVFTTVGAVATAFQRPAYLAAITQLVPKRYLGQANGLVTLGTSAGDLVAALAGGVLVGVIGLSAVVAVDVVTFTLALVVLLRVRFPDRLWVRQEETFRAEIAGGWRYLTRRRPLVVMVVFFVVFNFLFALPLVLTMPLVLAEHPPQVLGAVLAAGGLGAVVGAILMATWGGTERRALGMVGGTAVLGLGVVLLGLSPSAWVQGSANAVIYGALLVLNAHWLALIQTKVGLDLQGRVLSINQMLAMSTMPLGFLLAGPITSALGRAREGWLGGVADALGHRDAASPSALAILAVGVAITVWGIAGLVHRPLRRLEDGLPDAIPDAVLPDGKDELQSQADALLAAHRSGASRPAQGRSAGPAARHPSR